MLQVSDVMALADRHAHNGVLTLNELRTFLPRTRHEGFLRWLGGSGKSLKGGRFATYDRHTPPLITPAAALPCVPDGAVC